MGRYFHIALEYDGENPIRNSFLSAIDDLNYSEIRYWEDLYDSDLDKFSSKKNSIETRDIGGCYSWGIDNIAEKIKLLKKKLN